MAGFDRSRISGGLNRRTQQQTDTRESGGGILQDFNVVEAEVYE